MRGRPGPPASPMLKAPLPCISQGCGSRALGSPATVRGSSRTRPQRSWWVAPRGAIGEVPGSVLGPLTYNLLPTQHKVVGSVLAFREKERQR